MNPVRARKLRAIVCLVLAGAAVAGIFFLWPEGVTKRSRGLTTEQMLEAGGAILLSVLAVGLIMQALIDGLD